MQSQVKPSHCCRQTPWLAQDSSVQVVLGPGRAEGRNTPHSAKPPPSPGGVEGAELGGRSRSQPCPARLEGPNPARVMRGRQVLRDYEAGP